MRGNDDNSFYEVGFGKPPKHTRFAKGKSGNPRGRPRSSQNLATVLAKAGRERVKVTANGECRFITKFDATLLQLTNKAASGDLKAIRELLCWIRSLADFEQTALPSPVLRQSDSAVIARIIDRIRQSENQQSRIETDPEVKSGLGTEE
ncbi:MAG TPA: DUF5681 domain-containing protein [Candidatus Acidoferrales bacterium]|jgi:hypothetical protein|nr:DUF5681 domain-containing protein [Candidatus Acidoferrales bacterium]